MSLLEWVSRIQIIVSEMVILESTLTIFEANIIFLGSWGNSENWLEVKIRTTIGKSSLPVS
jgi:hypothetical protein